MFTHQKLRVYGKALAFVAKAATLSSEWGKQHAIVDHLDRASESIVLNIADGGRLWSGPSKLRALDYALGSALECAACLDIALIKELVRSPEASEGKDRLWEITIMLVGLRKAWGGGELKEESGPYRAGVAAADLEDDFTMSVWTSIVRG